MSIRVDTSSYYAGSTTVGSRALGVLGSAIPTNGLVYSRLTLPDDANKEVRMEVTSIPTGGVLFAQEDTVCTLSGLASGSYNVSYKLYYDGVLQGTFTNAVIVPGAKRALIFDFKFKQLPTASLGTGQQPLVWYQGRVRRRVASEGTPIIFEGGRMQLLGSNENLEI